MLEYLLSIQNQMHHVALIISGSDWNTLVNFAASIIAIFGVPSAIFKITRAQTAANAAQEAVSQMRYELLSFQNATSLAMIIEQLENLKTLHRHSAWIAALERYSVARRNLTILREKQKSLSKEHRSEVHAIITFLSQLEQQIERHVSKSEKLPDIAKVNKQISTSLEGLQTILYVMERSATGEQNVRS